MPYYPHIGSDAAQPNGTTGDVAIATDSMKLRLNVSGTWYEAGQSVGMLTLGGTVAKHELLGYSSGWVRAAKTVGGVIPAQYIALKAGVSGDVIPVAKRAVVSGSFTADAEQYLGTAGAITATRSTTGGDLRQRVGRAISTSQAALEIRGFREVQITMQLMDTEGASGSAFDSRVILDTDGPRGVTTNAQNEEAIWQFILPDNYVSLVRAEYLSAQEGAGSPTYTFTVNSQIAGAAGWDTVTADSSETAKAIGANSGTDPIDTYEFSAALNATNILRCGAFVFVTVKQDDAGTVEVIHLGGRLVILVAD